ncbi:MAG TPA: hypothetical protein VIS96_19355 [Terrimicrobiaceae bacterium]
MFRFCSRSDLSNSYLWDFPSQTVPVRPPTDSLYKFLAIGGIVLVCVSLFLPDKPFDELIAISGEFDREGSTMEGLFQRSDEIVDQLKTRNTEMDSELAPLIKETIYCTMKLSL